jgi:hypothetical protein
LRLAAEDSACDYSTRHAGVAEKPLDRFRVTQILPRSDARSRASAIDTKAFAPP